MSMLTSIRGIGFLLAAMVGAAAGYIVYASNNVDPGISRNPTTRPDLYANEKQTIDLFRNISPSVVFITTLQQQVSMFGEDLGQHPAGTGSGFVWDETGDIVTNFHVIQNASAARVSFSNGDEYDATVVGVAPENDLAVLKIKSTHPLSPIPIGTSSDLLVGQSVYAIGNPFGLDHTLTSGIVSALNRMMYSPTHQPIEGVIQTDASINPGNSGGPLLDSFGRLIGVNSAITSPTGSNAGIGFAIPVDTVNQIVPQLIKFGKVERATLGIAQRDDFTKQINTRLQVEGVVILAVYPGTAAEAAGLRGSSRIPNGIRVGDIMQKIDDKPIRNSDDLYLALKKHKPGDPITLTYWREGKTETKRVILDSSLNKQQ